MDPVRKPIPGLQDAQLVNVIASFLVKLVNKGLPGVLGVLDVSARLNPQIHLAVFVHEGLPLPAT